MNQVNNKKLQELLINDQESILNALKKIDKLDRKFLLVVKDKKFLGLLKIGDIQSAIIKNLSLETQIKDILQSDIRFAYIDENPEQIKASMFKYNSECMPLIDRNNTLVDVIFWEDVFMKERIRISKRIDLPVVIMAGGEGLRLKPFTNMLPKPLLPIGEKSIVENIMDRFIIAGCTRFYLSVNYKADLIKHYLSALRNPDYNIEYFQENKPLGTAGSMYLIKDKIKSTFFVSNCDILIDQDLIDLYNYHVENRNKITIVAALKHYQIPYGTIESGDHGILNSLNEKPEITFKINTGVYLLEPDVLQSIPENTFFHITELINKIKKDNGKIGVFPVSEKSWTDYGLFENLPFGPPNAKHDEIR
jgi:dTDP-glucose pyrophosphorylase